MHCAWGISTLYPDKLLWADLRESAVYNTDMMRLSNSADRDRRQLEYQRSMFVYDERDFLDMDSRMSATYDRLAEFSRPFTERAFGNSPEITS